MTDDNNHNMELEQFTALPIEELADKPVNVLITLPTELQAKVMMVMSPMKCGHFLSELSVDQRKNLLKAFINLRDSGNAENPDSDTDDEEEDLFDEEEPPADEPPQQIILRSDYESNASYCDAVIESMQAVLCKLGIRTEVRNVRPNVKAFLFDHTTQGVDIDCHILVDFNLCDYRIEFKFNVDNQPDRTPIIDYFCQDKNFSLRYGCFVMGHSDGEKKFKYNASFRGAFAEEAFEAYFTMMSATLFAYASNYAGIAGDKKLDAAQRKVVRNTLSDLCACLPARVKPENEEKFAKAAEALDGNLTNTQHKLLAYLVEHVK